jgi:ferredoxin-nitrate reductase
MGKNSFQCPYCGVGCGLITNRDPSVKITDEVVPTKLKVRGDKNHPANGGLVCLKGVTLPQTLNGTRLTKPLFRESIDVPFREISWEEALQIAAKRLKGLSPEEVYFYVSGQLTTEESYVINKFVKVFLKTNNIDANSRLCMASAVVAYKKAFGSDGPPCSYEDLKNADVFLFIGSNAAVAHPVLFNRIQRQKRPDAVIVTVDPYETETAKRSELFIRINAGTDTVLLNSVLYLLYKSGRINRRFVELYTEGFERAIAEAKKYPPEVAEKICGVRRSDIELLAYLFASAEKLISFWSMGLNQSVNGVMKNLALINLHLATGRLGEKGFPFSLTGQPNAMGGREVGYLSGSLPGYREVSNPAERKEVEQFWGLKGIKPSPGPTITEAVDLILEGKIKLLWVVGTNPAITLPNLEKVWKALKKAFLIVNEPYADADTLKFANLVFPAQVVPEKEGVMTGSDRTVTFINRQSDPPEGTRSDWEIFTALARLMGGEKFFNYKTRKKIFEEFKALTAGRLCDMSNLEEENLPARWGGRWLHRKGGTWKFPTPSGKARFHPAEFRIEELNLRLLIEEGFERALGEGKFILINGRIKNHWHTMTKTGKVDTLLKQELPPFAVMHPLDAAELGLEEGDTVEITDGERSIRRLLLLRKIKRRHVYTHFAYPTWFCPDPTNLLYEDRVDPYSKEPDLKFKVVEIGKASDT